MDLRSMLNEPSSQRPPQTQQQQQLQQQHHHHHQHPQPLQPLQPPPPSAQHHRSHQPPPLQPPQPPQQYQSPVYAPRQQQQFPPAQSPHHAPSPANQYPYTPPSPHGGPPVGQHHYSYPHSQGQPVPYGPAPSGAQGHQPHPQYPQLQHQQQQPPHQQQQQQPNHHQVNSNAGSPLQPQFYPPQSPHQQQQFNTHYPRHTPASPRGPPRPPLLQTGSNDRAPQHTISTPTSATRNPRGGEREIRQIERDRSISPKTRVPEETNRDVDSRMRDDALTGYQGNTGPHQGGVSNNVQSTRPNPHHRSQSQGIPHSAMRANSHVNQQGQPGNQLQRNMDVDTEHDGRMWSNTAPVTPVDRKGVNGFEHGLTNHNPHASSQAHPHQTQNAPIPNSTNNNAPSAAHPPTLSHPPLPPPPPPPHQQQQQQQHHQQQQQQQQQHQQIQQIQHQHQQQPPQPPPQQQQQHIQPVPSNNTQRPVTNSPSTKEQPSPLHPPSHHRSTPSNSSQFPNRPPQPPSPKPQRDRELLPPPAPPVMSGPPRKRPRHEEPPIFARKASRSTSNSPVMPTRRNPPGQPILQHDQPPQQQAKQEQQSQQSVPSQQSPLQPHPSQKAQAVPIKTGPPNVPQSPALTSHHRPSYPNEHPTLGSWEPSITNTIPYEELTRKITDFLFYHVVKNDDPCLDWTGSGGPVLEIEAKLGHLVHKQSQQRIALPIITEAVIADGYREVAFRSTMTEAQHKSFNRFLNERFAECQPKPQKPPSQGRSPSPSGTSSPTNATAPPKPPARVPMKYRHTKERDTFHEVPPREMLALPPLVTKLLGNSNKKPKIRLTTDEHGIVINKIIKCRVADLNVFSPGTAFDWRVSVNLEMPYTGEVDEKSGGIGGGKGDGRGGGGERNKDRMSYECLDGKFKVDLTQVTSTFETSKKEHELEIEMDSLTLKKHGTLAARSKENGFQEYVKGFVDNVRVLCKAVPPNY